MDALFDPRDLSRNELAAAAIRAFGELRLRATGTSMLPALRPDDVLLIRRCSIEEASPGDIVLYLRARRLFAHRVVSRPDTQLVTQGDAMAQADPPLAANEVLGKIVRVLRRGKEVRYGLKPALQRRMAAVLFRRSAMAERFFKRLQGLNSRAVP